MKSPLLLSPVSLLLSVHFEKVTKLKNNNNNNLVAVLFCILIG